MVWGSFAYPAGRITQAMFPGETLQTNIEAWEAEAAGKSSALEAQAHWVYHRAFQAVADRFFAEAVEVKVADQVSYKRLLEQAQRWEQEAAKEQALFENAESGTPRHAASGSANDAVFNTTTLSSF